MTKSFCCLPSDVLNIQDEYTAYCFNEACSYIKAKLEAGEQPAYIEHLKEKSYKSFKDLYKNIGG